MSSSKVTSKHLSATISNDTKYVGSKFKNDKVHEAMDYQYLQQIRNPSSVILKSQVLLNNQVQKMTNNIPKKQFKEPVNENYQKYKRYYQLKKNLINQTNILEAAQMMSPEQVMVTLCKLKPDAKSFNYTMPVRNQNNEKTGETTAKKFRSIINNHLNREKSDVESIHSFEDIKESDEDSQSFSLSDEEDFDWREREKQRRIRIQSGVQITPQNAGKKTVSFKNIEVEEAKKPVPHAFKRRLTVRF